MVSYLNYGKILRINLTNKRIRLKEPSPQLIRDYIGGSGFGLKLIYDEVDRKVDSLHSDNKLIFCIGPLTGTLAPAFSQTCVVTKSPLTNTLVDTYAGGFFGRQMRTSGYTAIVIEGKSDRPVYVSIINDEVKILKADHLWGLSTSEAQNCIKKDSSDSGMSIACIGQAGENLVRFSSIISDRHAHGRGGSGVVMGSKKLKAISIHGTKQEKIDDKSFLSTIREVSDILKQNKDPRSKYGTLYVLPIISKLGVLPTKNHLDGVFEGSDLIGPEQFEKFHIKHLSCFGCPTHCFKKTCVKEGIYANSSTLGPEFETVYALGSECGNDYAESIIEADRLCDEYGMDSISTGVCISFAMECFEKGLIDKKDTNGLSLVFGDYKSIIQMIHNIALRKGIGSILSEGTKRASQMIGNRSEGFAMHVKGMEFAGYMPRGMKGLALCFATSNRGACHKRVNFEEFTPKMDPHTYEGKSSSNIKTQDYVNAVFTLIMCSFMRSILPVGLIVKLLNTATRNDFTIQEFLQVGERITNLKRVFSGFTKVDDTLPRRCFTEPIPSGVMKHHFVHKEKFEHMLSEYYQLREWTTEGLPTANKLKELKITP